MKKSFLIPLIVIGLVLCFSITPIPINATSIITDPSGDASLHDILSISGGFNSSNLFLEATFQPGTFDPSNLGFLWGLDTDLNLATGVQPGPAFFPLGADFTVFFDWEGNTTRALVVKYGVGVMGTVPVSFGTNSLSLTVPFSFLDNDDGFALFGLAVGTPIDANSFSPTDFTPDLPNRLGGPTTPVPEPATVLLLGSGLIGLAGYGRKKFFKK